MTGLDFLRRVMTVSVVEDAIKLDHTRWPGNCNGVALKLLESGLLDGYSPVNHYGHWHGEVTDRWFKWHGPLQRHGWLVLEDGTVIDPTRWCFTGEEPYVYVGPQTDEYDWGGDNLREAAHALRPFPFMCEDGYGAVDPIHCYCTDERVELTPEFVERAIPRNLFGEPQIELDEDFAESEVGKTNATMRTCQVFWLANAPRSFLGADGKVVIKYLIRHGHGARVPVDTRQWAEGKVSAISG